MSYFLCYLFILKFEGQDRLQCEASLGFQFILHYTDTSHGGNATTIPIPESSKRSVHVSGLRTCTEYEISIGVMNFVGVESLPSTSMRQYTLSESKISFDNLPIKFTQNQSGSFCCLYNFIKFILLNICSMSSHLNSWA